MEVRVVPTKKYTLKFLYYLSQVLTDNSGRVHHHQTPLFLADFARIRGWSSSVLRFRDSNPWPLRSEFAFLQESPPLPSENWVLTTPFSKFVSGEFRTQVKCVLKLLHLIKIANDLMLQFDTLPDPFSYIEVGKLPLKGFCNFESQTQLNSAV